MRKLKFITVDRWDFTKNLENTKQIQKILQQQQSILIFPEGTFTYAKGLRPFKAGAFQLAVNSQTCLCPVAIKGSRKFLSSVSYLFSPAKITLTVCDPIKPNGQDWDEVVRLRNEVRKTIAKYCGEPMIDIVVPGPEA